jgi:hypothetical protein
MMMATIADPFTRSHGGLNHDSTIHSLSVITTIVKKGHQIDEHSISR